MADGTFKSIGDAQLGHVTTPETTDAMPLLRSAYTGAGKDGYVLWSDLEALLARKATAYFSGGGVMLPGSGTYLSYLRHYSATTVTGIAGNQEIVPFLAQYSFTSTNVGFSVSGLATGSTVTIVLFNSDSNGRPTTLNTQTAAVATTSTGFKSTAWSVDFTAGTLYWIGVWHSATAALRAQSIAANHALAWSTGSTPIGVRLLTRNETYGGTSSDWTYSTSQHSTTRNIPSILIRAN